MLYCFVLCLTNSFCEPNGNLKNHEVEFFTEVTQYISKCMKITTGLRTSYNW